MEKETGRLTVFFEAPFWVGVYERSSGGRLEAARVVFGAEPRDCEVYEFFLKNWASLKFSPSVAADSRARARENPKRAQRAIIRELRALATGGTKAQQALQLQREQAGLERNAARHQRQDEEKQRRFEQHQQKKKQKHKGR